MKPRAQYALTAVAGTLIPFAVVVATASRIMDSGRAPFERPSASGPTPNPQKAPSPFQALQVSSPAIVLVILGLASGDARRCSSCEADDTASTLTVTARSRVKQADGEFKVQLRLLAWEARQTAIIICDK